MLAVGAQQVLMADTDMHCDRATRATHKVGVIIWQDVMTAKVLCLQQRGVRQQNDCSVCPCRAMQRMQKEIPHAQLYTRARARMHLEVDARLLT